MKLWILGLASALLVLLNLEARASVLLDWGSVPESQKHLELIGPPGPNATYSTGTDFSKVDVTVAGSNLASVGLHDPNIDPKSVPFPVPVLSGVTNFKPAGTGTPTVTFTIDFFGYKQGVKDVSFTLFNIDDDKTGQGLFRDIVTFKTAGLAFSGVGKDVAVSGNTLTGNGDTGHSPTDFPAGDVTVHSGNLPLHQIVFNWTQSRAGEGRYLDELAIGDISFVPVTPVPEVGQLVIGLVACLLGALWLHENRRKRAHSIP